MICLPLAGYVFFYLVLRVQGQGWRAAAIGAATIWGSAVVLITELLSVLHDLTRNGLAVAWLVVDMAALVCVWLVARGKLELDALRVLYAAPRHKIQRPMLVSAVMLSGVGIIVVLVAITALLSPPNTWDVLAYHMPRVVHWIQNRSVAFYPTPELRQLHMPPWAEYAMLHMYMLFGSDRLVNLVQWCSLLGSVVGVTLLAQLLGASSRGQVLAAVLCVTIPQGILEASGAKNDYVVAFWLVALTYYFLSFKHKPTLTSTSGIGASLGLAWLTKGTAYVFSAPILLTAGLLWPWKPKIALLKRLPLVLVFALVLNAGHFARNYSLYSSPLGPSAESPSGDFKYTNDEITAATLISNILRNLSVHLGTPIRAVNLTLEQWIEFLISLMGDDPNNPRTTWSGTIFHVPEMSRHEALAGNPLHLMLILSALGLMIASRRFRTTRDVVTFAIALALAFLLFCALLRWQPWHTRLHLPLFVLWSVVVGTILAYRWPPFVTTGLGTLLLLLSVPAVLGNQLRPLAFAGELDILRQERRELYFAENRALLDAYQPVAAFVKEQDCGVIGLDSFGDSPVYALYILLDAGEGKRSIHYVGVRNPSSRYGLDENSLKPCAVICLGCTRAPEKWKVYLPRVGPATVFPHIVVFRAPNMFPLERSPMRQSQPCTFTFVKGWHAMEKTGQDWWRWTDGRGQIQVFVTRDSAMVMLGEVYAAQRPNRADLLINGEKIVTWEIAQDAIPPFEPVALRFKAGENSLVFASHDPATHIPTDSRALALAVKNLLIVDAGGTSICQMQP